MALFGNNSISASSYTASVQSHLISGSAPASDVVTQLFIYCAGNAGASTSLTMALYADSAGNPGARLGISSVATIPNGQAAGWIEVDLLSGVSVVSGTTYWIAMVTNAGGATFRYSATGTTKGRGDGTLPDPYGTPGWTDSATFSMYAQLGAVPSSTVAPTVSGSSTDGATLTSTTGSWANTPTSYAYQWTRDGTNITGATSSTYVVTLADRTHAVGCKVTATNALGSSPAVASSNTITGTAPTVTAAGKLRWAPLPQVSPTVVDLTAAPGDYFATWVAGADYVVNLSSTVPRTGLLEIDANGARSVKIVGGLFALNDGGTKNYHIHIQNLAGWAFIEGVEADMANTHADFLSISGGSLYRPDVYVQNCRAINLTATDATNHADIFQPQGLIGRVYVDKLTFSSNYQGFTIAADGSTGSSPATAVNLARVNSWFSSANATNPFTAHYWLNNADAVSGHDTAPFPLSFNDVWCDLVRGAGRAAYSGKVSLAIFPSESATGAGKAGGGTLSTGGASPFTAAETIGAEDIVGDAYAAFNNPKLLVSGVLKTGSPSTARTDVVTELDASGSFVPAGVGSSYVTPGYASPGVFFLGPHAQRSGLRFIDGSGLNL